MKKYNSSDLSNNRSEVLEEAAKNGVIIQEKNTNSKVRREFYLVERCNCSDIKVESEGKDLILKVIEV
jgi:hypothetical protein